MTDNNDLPKARDEIPARKKCVVGADPDENSEFPPIVLYVCDRRNPVSCRVEIIAPTHEVHQLLLGSNDKVMNGFITDMENRARPDPTPSFHYFIQPGGLGFYDTWSIPAEWICFVCLSEDAYTKNCT